MGAGLRPDAKASEPPPDPNAGAPPLDSTARQRRSPPAGTECCVAFGNVRREAYTGVDEAARLSHEIC